MGSNNAVSFTHIENFAQKGRAELRAALGLTGCEVSINTLPAGVAIPFVHAHRENEELYIILSGAGLFWLDGEVRKLQAGDAIRVAPAVGRCLKAAEDESLSYICVQSRQNGTPTVTREDGYPVQTELRWG